MIRLLNTWFPKSLVAAAAGAGLFAASIGDASACDRGRSSYRPAYRPAYPTQHCQNPVQNSLLPYGQGYGPQTQFQQPVPPQVQQLLPHGLQVPIQGQQQVVQGQQQVVQGQQQIMQGQQGVQQNQQVIQGQQIQQGVAAQGITQQSNQASAVATPSPSIAAPLGGASAAQGSVSAIGALGGSQPAAAPAQAQAPAPTSTAQAPAQAPAQAQPQSPPASAEQTATESALQALMGETAPAIQSSQPVTSAQQPAPIGEFSAALTNGTTVRLSLRADGSFSWVATKGDKVSSFQGTFAFGGTSLTLNRASDSQKLQGSLAMTASGFKLQLGGQNGEGLNFVRA